MPLLSKQAEKLCARLDLSRLTARPRNELAFVEVPVSPGGPLLLDTSVYIHQLMGKAPTALQALIGVRLVNHSVVAVQEMLHAIGALDPADPRTKGNIAAIRSVLGAIPSHRLFTPSRDILVDAAIHAGILCRLRSYARDQRMKALHDCTLFLQARKLGFTLVSANVIDFELLQQIQPEGQVLVYETL